MMYNIVVILLLMLWIPSQSFAEGIKVFAHRGGASDFPENTVYAFKKAVGAGVYGIELDVQLTKDQRVVVYHPRDLAKNTNGGGEISQHNYAEIKNLDAGFNFDPTKNRSFPHRDKGHYIPLLEEVLELFPTLPIIIDFKSLPVEPLVDAVVKLVDDHKAWNRIIFYSTNPEHIDYLTSKAPNANVFEARHTTVQRLLELRNNKVCCCANESRYIGFELAREMNVEEKFELGSGEYKVLFRLWDADSISCIKKGLANKQIFLFNINDKSEYSEAKKLKVDAIFTNSPLTVLGVK